MADLLSGGRDTGSLTLLFHKWHAGDALAEAELFERLYPAVLKVARSTPAAKRAAIASGRDFAQCALLSFHQRFIRENLRGDETSAQYWALLVQIVKRKAAEHGRWETAQKRGGGQVLSANSPEMQLCHPEGLEGISAKENSFAAVLDLECQELLEDLDEAHKEIVVNKLMGHENKEIAQMIGRTERTVERKLALIRQKWSR